MAALPHRTELRYLVGVKAEFILAATQVDEPFEYAQDALRDGKSRGPQQDDPGVWLQHAAEFPEDGIDLAVGKVLHYAYIPEAVDRTVLEWQRENVADEP